MVGLLEGSIYKILASNCVVLLEKVDGGGAYLPVMIF
jgi:hypothetical protein